MASVIARPPSLPPSAEDWAAGTWTTPAGKASALDPADVLDPRIAHHDGGSPGPKGAPMKPRGLRTRWVLTPSRIRVAGLLSVILLSVAGTAWLLEGVREVGDLALWDRPTMTWLVAHRTPVATSAMTAVTTIGGPVALSVIAAVTVLVLAVRRHRVEALLLAVALASAEAISVVLKHLVGRARPPAPDVLNRLEHTLSFPSGHTIGTATFTLTLAYLWWRARPGKARAWGGAIVALALTALMATSRLYLGDHWLTDVLASIALSFAVVSSVILLDLRMRRERRP